MKISDRLKVKAFILVLTPTLNLGGKPRFWTLIKSDDLYDTN